MGDKTRDNVNYQKRAVCVLVAPLVEADILVAGSIYGVIPERSIIKSVRVNVKTISGTSSATLDVLAGAAVIANEVAVTVAGVIVGTDVPGENWLATGGNITVRSGSVSPANGAFIGDLIIEYIELDKKTGEYTQYYEA